MVGSARAMSALWKVTNVIDVQDRVDAPTAAFVTDDERWAIVVTETHECVLMDLRCMAIVARVALNGAGSQTIEAAGFVRDGDSVWVLVARAGDAGRACAAARVRLGVDESQPTLALVEATSEVTVSIDATLYETRLIALDRDGRELARSVVVSPHSWAMSLACVVAFDPRWALVALERKGERRTFLWSIADNTMHERALRRPAERRGAGAAVELLRTSRFTFSGQQTLAVRAHGRAEVLFPPGGDGEWSVVVDSRGARCALSNGQTLLVIDLATGATIAEHATVATVVQWTDDDVALLLFDRGAAQFVLLSLQSAELAQRWIEPVLGDVRCDVRINAGLDPSQRYLVAILEDNSVVLVDRVTREHAAIEMPIDDARWLDDESQLGPCFDGAGGCFVGGWFGVLRVDLRERTVTSVLQPPDDWSVLYFCSQGAISGAWSSGFGRFVDARLHRWDEGVVRERSVEFPIDGRIDGARSAPVFATHVWRGLVYFVRLDGERLGTVSISDVPDAAPRWAMSGDGTTLVLSTARGRIFVAKYQGDPRSLQLPE